MIDLRMEYPRPLLERKNWLCLNGQWEFEMDTAEVGKFKKYWERPSLNGEITVPYCPESKLSGIGHTDFIGCCWYRRTFTLPESFAGKATPWAQSTSYSSVQSILSASTLLIL